MPTSRTSARSHFGSHVRRLRLKRGITLRRFAQRIRVSPTYVSLVERGELPPPSEEKIALIARVLGEDKGELMVKAKRIPAEVTEAIMSRPREMFILVTRASSASSDELEKVMSQLVKPGMPLVIPEVKPKKR